MLQGKSRSDILVYIYGLSYDHSPTDYFYVGKSIRPYKRNLEKQLERNIICTILDTYVDLEQQWIVKLQNQGHILENKELLIRDEEHKIGDVLKLSPQSRTKQVKDLKTGIIYDSITKAQKATNYKNLMAHLYHNRTDRFIYV